MKVLLYLVGYITYPFSFLFPRNRKKYSFGSFAGAFNDNAKYLFIYTCEHCPNINAAWISNNRHTVRHVQQLGLKSYFIFSLKGIWHALTSRYWFFNSYTSDIMFSLSGGATCINLWHGVGLKRIEYNILNGPLGERYQKTNFYEVFCHPQSFRAPDYIITSTPFQTHLFSTAFRIPSERCLELGYPRNQILGYDGGKLIEFVRMYEPEDTLDAINRMKGYSKVLIYMPTWRDSQRHLFTQSMDLTRLNEVMSKNNELLVLKPHSNMIIEESIRGFSNIMFLPGSMDVYPLLPYTTGLITDYSSVLYDYLLMPEKDVILYLYDYEDYIKERDLFYPFDENVAGRKVYNYEDLLDVIANHDYRMDNGDRELIVEKFWGRCKEYNSNRAIIDFVNTLD